MFQKHGDSVWVNFHALIDEHHIVAFCFFHAKPDYIAFALIFDIAKSFHPRYFRLLNLFERFIKKPVYNRDYFMWITDIVQDPFYLKKVFDNGFFLPVDGDYEA